MKQSISKISQYKNEKLYKLRDLMHLVENISDIDW